MKSFPPKPATDSPVLSVLKSRRAEQEKMAQEHLWAAARFDTLIRKLEANPVAAEAIEVLVDASKEIVSLAQL